MENKLHPPHLHNHLTLSQRRTDNTIVKRKSTKREILIHKTVYKQDNVVAEAHISNLTVLVVQPPFR